MTPRNSSMEIRAEIDRHLAAGNWVQTQAALHQLWNAEQTLATAAYVISCCERLRPFLNLSPCRVAILRSFTLEPAVPLLRAAALLGGIDVTVQMTGFDNYAQQMLDPASDLYAFNPDMVLFAVQTRDIAPAIWENCADNTPEEQEDQAKEVTSAIGEWVRIFRSRSTANLVLHTFEKPPHPCAGILDAQSRAGQTGTIQKINEQLQDLAAEHSGVYLLDYDGLVSRQGRITWRDERKWLTLRMPIAAHNLFALAKEWLRYLHPLTGRIGKVLVTDLDDTLWGGVIGEDGVGGIQVGQEYPGAGYRMLQKALLALLSRGVMLAIASKNNEEDALEAIRNHPGMVLRPSHFAAIRINWSPKEENLRRIAEELNVGLDSLVFLDDNPIERQSIRIALPEVTVIELPADSLAYADAVWQCPLFERLTSSAEDRERTQYHVQQRQRQDLQKSVSSLEDFYYSLEQKVEIARLSKDTLARAAQLIKKTNQFNMTSRRYNEAQIAQFTADPNYDVYTARVSDRFGNNGMVGVCITRREADVCEIDTLLLSCRVIGRTVESAILSFLVEENQSKGVARLEGWFAPTRKNKPAESFYRNHNFQLKDQTKAGSLWSLDLGKAAVNCPPWIQLNAQWEAEVGECARA